LLSVITLFEKIGVSREYIDQIEFIRETFLDSTKEEAIELIELLKSKGLITQKGDYVIANSFKQELIQYWKEQPIEDVNLVVKNVSNNNLWHNFSDKFFDILKNDKSGDYINSLNSREGVLKDNSFVDTNEGGEFVNLLADYFPSIAQEVIKSKIERL
jgi:hypothetical protein